MKMDENWAALDELWLCRITLPRSRLPRSRHDLDYNVWPKLIRENKLRVGLESHSMVARLCLPKADWHFDSFIVHYQNPKRMRLHMLYDDNQMRVNEMLLQHSKTTLGCVKYGIDSSSLPIGNSLATIKLYVKRRILFRFCFDSYGNQMDPN